MSALLTTACSDGLSETKVTIVSADQTHDFTVEIADNDKERAQGLMHRRELDRHAGMLFKFPKERILSFWMKNTYIPLDLIYIDRDGVIIKIARNAEPLSLRSLPSGKPAVAVLEINGGLADELGISEGDIVEHPFFVDWKPGLVD
ncbi:MAG: DUF192 domain-containing protein [bacterium]